MKVLITDYAWESLQPEREILASAGATLVVAERGDEDELASLAKDVDGILTCWKPVTARVIRRAERCRAIGRYGIGVDNIDVECATELGIVVTNVSAYCVEEVAEHAMALLLSLARKVTAYDHAMKAGRYDLRALMPFYRLRGKTLGIVGFGKIGRALYRKAQGFEFKVLICDPNLDPTSLRDYQADCVRFTELLERSDFVSIHVPLTPETRGLFNAEAFRRMKPGSYLINTCRGAVIDEAALLEALNAGRIAGAGLDVLASEPPSLQDPLGLHPRAIVTPHAAFYSAESVLELQTTAARQMAEVLSGRRPSNIVNPEVLRRSNLRARFRSSV
ncbi:MAG: C-terminal binding protein [Acidobacteriia bacterium]|nr:C-terminal binding protein [Terriglobia bacterium]